MRDTYDVIVVGGGHNGLVAAIDLTRAGWSVLVAEACANVGGCAITTEPLLPGFRHNPHANTFLFTDLMPPAISPAKLDVPVHQPEAQLGVAFADGRPPVILHRPDLLSETRSSLSAYSRADGQTYVELKQRSADLGPLLRQGMYGAPDSAWFEAQRTAVQRAYKGLLRLRTLGGNTARAVIDELFEAPEVRILLYTLATETSVDLEEAGGDIAFLGYSLWIAGRWRFPEGGMQTYSDALHRAAVAAGAHVALSTCATKISLTNRRAVGIETSKGDVVGASKAVLAATPILHLFDALLDANSISPGERDELKAFRRASLPSIGTSFFCLAQAPDYKSAQHAAQINACLKTTIGFETPSNVLEHQAEARAGRLPRAAGTVRTHSIWDKTLAPRGFHVAGVDSSFPAANDLDRDTWQLVMTTFPTAFFDMWRRYLVSNEHNEPPLAMYFDHAPGFERRMLIRMGSDQYRTSIPGLYLAGPGVYPGGGVHGACGRNAAQTVLADYEDRGRLVSS
jgi:phytoene dehydrogenase-like protein